MDLSSYKYKQQDFHFKITKNQCYQQFEKLKTYKEDKLINNDINVRSILMLIKRMN